MEKLPKTQYSPEFREQAFSGIGFHVEQDSIKIE